MHSLRKRRLAAAPSRMRERSSGQNSTVFRMPDSSPAFFSRTPLENRCFRPVRDSRASKVKSLSREKSSPLMKAESTPNWMSSRSYRARWEEAVDR